MRLPKCAVSVIGQVIAGMLVLTSAGKGFAQSWLSPWLYRTPLVIQNSSGNTLQNIPVRIVLNTQQWISAGKMNPDCSDLRFTDADGSTVLHYFVYDGCNTTQTIVWVKALNIRPGVDTIFIYYGNPNAVSQSSMDSVFFVIGTQLPEDTVPGATHSPLLSDISTTVWWDAGSDHFDGFGYTDFFATGNLSGTFLNDIVIDPPESGGTPWDTLILSGRSWILARDMHKVINGGTVVEGVLRTIFLPASDLNPYSVRRHGNLGCDGWCTYVSWNYSCPNGISGTIWMSCQGSCATSTERVWYTILAPGSASQGFTWSGDNPTHTAQNVSGPLIMYLAPTRHPQSSVDVVNYLCREAAFWEPLDSSLFMLIDSYLVAFSAYDISQVNPAGLGAEEIGCFLFPPPALTVLVSANQDTLFVDSPEGRAIYVWKDCLTGDSVGEGPYLEVPYSGWFFLEGGDTTLWPNCKDTSTCISACIDNIHPQIAQLDSFLLVFPAVSYDVIDQYVWYDCETNLPVDTVYTFGWNPPQAGRYRVMVKAFFQACQDTSVCVEYRPNLTTADAGEVLKYSSGVQIQWLSPQMLRITVPNQDLATVTIWTRDGRKLKQITAKEQKTVLLVLPEVIAGEIFWITLTYLSGGHEIIRLSPLSGSTQ